MFRTQIYLEDAQKEALGKYLEVSGKSQSSLIREAIALFLSKQKKLEWKKNLRKNFGAFSQRFADKEVKNTRESFDRNF